MVLYLMEHTLNHLLSFAIFFPGVTAKRFKKEKQPFNSKSVKVTTDGNHEFPGIARQVELLGKERNSNMGFQSLGKNYTRQPD